MIRWLPWIVVLLVLAGAWAILWQRKRSPDKAEEDSSGYLVVLLILVAGSVASYFLITSILGGG